MSFGWALSPEPRTRPCVPAPAGGPVFAAVGETPPRWGVAGRSSAIAALRQADAPPSASSNAAAASRRGGIVVFKGPPDWAPDELDARTGGERWDSPPPGCVAHAVDGDGFCEEPRTSELTAPKGCPSAR